MFKHTIDESQQGTRVDKYLSDRLPQYPRAVIKKLFDLEHIWLNDAVTKPGYKLKIGDVLKADVSSLTVKIPDIDLPIIYEDDNVLVVDKPVGIISHARGVYFDEPSVASFIRQRYSAEAKPASTKSWKDQIANERTGIVHRLDRATSGVMITAKNPETLSFLQKQFSDRTVKKSYTALIQGHLPSTTGLIDMPIGRNPSSPKSFHVTDLGKSAKTRYEEVASNDKYTIINLRPETGRTHQLRVHLNHLGHPIVGDELYKGQVADRLMLHAESLEITIPSKDSSQPNQRMVFKSKIPEVFQAYVAK